jgi:uracil-DNA glycosylase
MTHAFCPGYPPPYDGLVRDYPGVDVYPPHDFRVEWGPMFHRGRLDGSARVLVIGQDPGQQENVARRILVGVAGQRTQGLLTKLGVDSSYVMVNTYLYSVASQQGGNNHEHDNNIAAYRNRWFDAIAANNELEAIITLGGLATTAYNVWHGTPTGAACTAHHAGITHPTADGHTHDTAALLTNWNSALPGLHSAITHPDVARALEPYGATFTPADLTPIPEGDLPAGLPDWMRSLEPWATRGPGAGQTKRATLTVTVPTDQRAWIGP